MDVVVDGLHEILTLGQRHTPSFERVEQLQWFRLFRSDQGVADALI